MSSYTIYAVSFLMRVSRLIHGLCTYFLHVNISIIVIVVSAQHINGRTEQKSKGMYGVEEFIDVLCF